ncbi:hypothetical protein BL250_15925 [Erwinia sp. OLTSP20]|uniref:VOC family protein n=1 Tax=unclassified Erwinia TaxID=2622719 RepID=UPI000C173CE4|nr:MULTISPECIES: VOC family protein [unclassified Erwinia]PIJ48500.1 hypothetical protein BV501_16855 [Erwinia sp. OAMSP11]PIJ66799.1 hypothetical protein BK416_17355 [Erwinia sp. OLSSP12]PIJ78773.1 hypothetical protein BLD47_16795 [Erwinia sp. OLCASP19]PIJ80118.1 hypothetical protein BLD46_16045 [Erwinia sp. OLMTSP26]PIJ82187.1 hypothetical protein BLD49_15720 [Erwinia sp. OLMDSP33]
MTSPVAFPSPVLDHVVINVADKLDEASNLYQRLGFQLSARGHHTLGSSNHLAIFGENYLELLGYEPGQGDKRKDLWQAPAGLTGLVWKTHSADSEFRHLKQHDLDGDPPASFSRPVTLPDGQQTDARFRTVRLRPSLVPNGRSFFCQHDTPAAVWQTAWQQHPNGVRHITEFVIVAQQPASAAAVYRRLFGDAFIEHERDGSLAIHAGNATVRIMSAQQAQAIYGTLPRDYDGSARMSALSLQTDSLSKVKTNLSQGNIPFQQQANAIIVAADDAFNLTLRFHL